MTGAGGTSWLLALCLSRVGVCTVFLVYAATLPVLQREWAMSATAAGSIASLFQLAYALSLMACSEIADRVGARRVFALGTVACAVAAVLFAAFARDYWSGLTLSTLLALTLGGTYTTGMLLIAEHVPVARRARAMGGYLAGYSLGLALGLVVSGVALTRGGYQLAFWLVAAGPVLGGLAVWPVLRGTPDTVRPRDEGGAARAVLRNRPAMLVVAGYAFHSWELLGMWAWTPAFLAACFVSAGSAPTEGAGRGAYVVALFHLTGTVASLLAGALADRVGRTPVLAVMAGLSAACSFVFGWLHGAPVALVAAVGLLYSFAALGDSPIYSTAITEIVEPAYRGAALALRSLVGYAAGAAAPLLFGAILDWQAHAGAAAWGWAFASLGLAGVGAVVSVLLLHRHPAAHVLTRAP